LAILRHHVSAGTFRTGVRQPLLLQAYLGTCVGLAVYCKSTGVGGIIHLLLPQPVSASSAVQPEKYASTGVPLFLKSLMDLGAQPQTLVASLAGGALVGPLSNQDLSLDIGGRTAEVVRTLLQARNIKIEQSETGGFFTCCLSLDLDTGRCTIEPAGTPASSGPVEVKGPDRQSIRLAMKRLKPIPQVALKVLRLMDEQAHEMGEITNEIRKDQVITARTLGLANSVMFAKKRAIESLEHALVYLGRDQVVKLILSAAVQSFFEHSAMGYSLCKGGLYHHALDCAHLAEALAVRTGKVAPHKAYTAGLLHDIGKVVLDQYMAPAYPLFYRKSMEQYQDVLTVEQSLFGIDHVEVGHQLALQWHLPDYLAHAIRYHHCPQELSEHRLLTIIVYLSDLLLSRFRIGVEIERLDTRSLESHLAALGMGIDAFAGLVDLIPGTAFNTKMADVSQPGSTGSGKERNTKPHVHQ
jgi:putative nucleotidyltransferase with HDIG domain